MSIMKGTIVAIRGIVVEMRFEESVPKIYDAVVVETKNKDGDEVIIEVLQQLEDGLVRGIAMAATDGLKRGDEVRGT